MPKASNDGALERASFSEREAGVPVTRERTISPDPPNASTPAELMMTRVMMTSAV